MDPQTATTGSIQPLRIPGVPRSRSGRRRLTGPRRVTGSWRTTTRIASSVLLGCTVLLVIATAVAMAVGVIRFTVVDSGSMRPTLNPGDVVLLRSERPSALADGQIVAFHPPGESHVTVVHRVASVERAPSGIVMRTKGDANNASDTWRARVAGDTVWRASLTIPWAGYLVVWSKQPAIRLGVLVLMLTLVVGMLLARIWRPTASRGITAASSGRCGRPRGR
jgi:signal peptidase I